MNFLMLCKVSICFKGLPTFLTFKGFLISVNTLMCGKV
ncbi:unnamed protein product [Gulo gulo]|uniref:Uncharacterized protein n=1 Tax=Gulo gulo TaxID=48420 RepID=A0A9X9LMB2_GULGU|nr:unnamed protein product [Gulo gulo]